MTDALVTNRRQLMFGASGLAAATAASAPASAATRPAKTVRNPQADTVARTLHAAQPTPALSLAVAGPSGLWTACYGKADLERDIPTTPDHRFRLGSVSKVLTSTTAARLASRGVLDLDAPVSAYLPDLPAQHRQTTLKQLLTHQGGVRHYLGRDADRTAPGGALDGRIYPSNREILATFINDPLVGPPGSQVAYSTFGYTLASLAMEAAAKVAFPDLVKQELGMLASLSSLEADCPISLVPMRVSGYQPSREVKFFYPRAKDGWANARQANPAYKWAGGGLVMTPADLARFGAALLDTPGSKLSAGERLLLFTPLTEATKSSPPLGLGWRVDEDPRGRRRWHHAGAQEGGRASLVIYPELRLSVAIASNVATVPGNVLTPSSDLADAFG